MKPLCASAAGSTRLVLPILTAPTLAFIVAGGTICSRSAQSQEAPKSAFAKPIFVRQLPIACAGMVYSPASHRLYASVPPASGTQGAVLTIDPATGAIDKTVPIASPGNIAASADGKYLYVIQAGGKSVGRFSLSAGKVDLQIPCAPAEAFQVLVSPQDSDRIVILRRKVKVVGFESPSLYDNGVLKAAGVGAPVISAAAFSSDGKRLYGYDESASPFPFYILNLDSNGWAAPEKPVSSLIDGRGQRLEYAGGLLYTTGGAVIDPEHQEMKGRLADAGGVVVPDLASGRVFSIRKATTGIIVTAYDPKTFAALGQTSFPKIAGEPSDAQACGDVLAFRGGAGLVLIASTPGLIDACKTRKWLDAFAMLDDRVNVDCQDESGASALMWAAYSGQADLVDRLLKKRSQVRLKDARDATALHYAIESGNIGIVTELLKAGADPNATGKAGSPVKAASDKRRPDLVHLIQQYGGH